MSAFIITKAISFPQLNINDKFNIENKLIVILTLHTEVLLNQQKTCYSVRYTLNYGTLVHKLGN